MVAGRKEGGPGLASFCSNNNKSLFSSGSCYQAPFPAFHSRKPGFSWVLTSPKGQASRPSACCCCSCHPGPWGPWIGTQREISGLEEAGQSQAACEDRAREGVLLQTVSKAASPRVCTHTCTQFPLSPAPHQGPFLSLSAWEPSASSS